MESKFKRNILIAVALIMLVGVINFGYAQFKSLDEPIFFKHYFDYDMENGSRGHRFYYVTNSSDDRSVVSMLLDDGNYMIIEHTQVHEMPYYKLVELYVKPIQYIEEPTTYTQLEILYSDGDRQTVDIGEINFLSYKRSELGRMSTVSSSNDNSFSMIYNLNEPVEVLGYRMSESVIDSVEVYLSVDGRSYQEGENAISFTDENLPIQAKQKFKLSGQIKEDNFIVFDVFFYLETDKGEMMMRNFNAHPRYEYNYVKAFIESRRD